MTNDLTQFHNVFFEESVEHLQTMEDVLINISTDDPDPEDLNTIFRAAHSIKGGSGIFGFDALTGITHVMETLLDKARNQELALSSDIVDTLLATCDILTNILQSYQEDSEINWASIDSGIEALEAILGNTSGVVGSDSQEQGFGFFDGAVGTESNNEADDFGFFDDAPGSEQIISEDKDEGFGFFEPVQSESQITQTQEQQDGFGFFETEQPSDATSAKDSANSPEQPKQPVRTTTRSVTGNNKKDSGSVRVDTTKIDDVMNLVGELVITQSMLRMIGREIEGSTGNKFEGAIEELSRNIREIQESVMSMRMLPVSFVFNRFPRLVRDLANKLEKQIELKIEGGNTEVDKSMIEKLADPLTHLVRNSLDHGIEDASTRLQQGKSEVGTITLKAQQRGGNILISIHDDGGGLNRDKIIAKARSNGVLVDDGMPDSEVWKLIFEPGFSTADAVTDVSGRGVGMDVVRKNIEAINGSIEIESTAGKGSVFSIKLPLTLAILDGMCVKSHNQVYVVPLTNIVESMQPSKEQLKSLGNDDLLWVRERYWPILRLAKIMDVEPQQDQKIDSSAVIVLIEASRLQFGLLIDELIGQQQVVIKSLESHYRSIPGIAGATIMGDGNVALILDIDSIANSSNVTALEEANV